MDKIPATSQGGFACRRLHTVAQAVLLSHVIPCHKQIIRFWTMYHVKYNTLHQPRTDAWDIHVSLNLWLGNLQCNATDTFTRKLSIGILIQHIGVLGTGEMVGYGRLIINAVSKSRPLFRMHDSDVLSCHQVQPREVPRYFGGDGERTQPDNYHSAPYPPREYHARACFPTSCETRSTTFWLCLKCT